MYIYTICRFASLCEIWEVYQRCLHSRLDFRSMITACSDNRGSVELDSTIIDTGKGSFVHPLCLQHQALRILSFSPTVSSLLIIKQTYQYHHMYRSHAQAPAAIVQNNLPICINSSTELAVILSSRCVLVCLICQHISIHCLHTLHKSE